MSTRTKQSFRTNMWHLRRCKYPSVGTGSVCTDRECVCVDTWTYPCRREYPFARTGRNCADGLRSHGWRMRPCRRVVPARTYTSVHEEASICQILSLRMGRIHVDGECICMDVDAWTQSVPTETSFSLYGHHPSM